VENASLFVNLNFVASLQNRHSSSVTRAAVAEK
jgi:hypothetical protein